ncbi:MAG: hypothetical protein IKL82_00585 [Clostridia bacterium]|nr:hypothetical protein [Clostridia bacterium]
MKNYYANKEYNRKKRTSALTMSILLIFLTVGMATVFIASKDYMFASVFGICALMPIFTIPATFKSYPVHSKPLVTITDKDVTVFSKTVKFSDIKTVKVIIELPSSKLDSENKKLLEDMKSVKPENIYYGNFDVVYTKPDGKVETLYSHVDFVVDALETLVEMGFKNYVLSYSVKKQSVVSTYDFRGEMLKRKQEEQIKTSKKQKIKQLI